MDQKKCPDMEGDVAPAGCLVALLGCALLMMFAMIVAACAGGWLVIYLIRNL